MAGSLTRPDTGSAEPALVGRHAVLEALRAGRPVSRIFVSRSGHGGGLRDIVDAARRRGVPVQTVDPRRLEALARGLVHQGVAAITAAQPLAGLDQVLDVARRRGEPPFLILLDGVEDPHNLGAVVRTAEAAGAHGVVVPRRRAAGLTPAVARAAAGATAHLPVAGVGNMVAAIEELKRAGVWVVGADPEAGERYDAGALAPPIALVVGAEGRGLHRLVRERCDRLVSIPLHGRVRSLNVSVAAALLLYEVARNRPHGGGRPAAHADERPETLGRASPARRPRAAHHASDCDVTV
ncbi:MAG TPA: 23S rRNA (guanosine(2251)-2'-O)-methyltransferase RlmB [bacterium]|nr:23S rRNA (guanosine(2251)-2'-O)-methyltransferase RlmB [bacterium]